MKAAFDFARLPPNERCSRRAGPSRLVVYRMVESPAAELGR